MTERSVVEYPTVEDLMQGEGFLFALAHSSSDATIPEQINQHYAHGGGWNPLEGWSMIDAPNGVVCYPGDPVLKPDAKAQHGNETVFFYRSGAWLGVYTEANGLKLSRVD